MDLQGVIFWGNFVSAHLFCPEYSAHSAESLQGKSRIQSRHLVLQLLLRGVFWFCFFNAGDENAKQVLFYWVTFPLGPSITSWVAQSDLGLAILPQPPQDIYICPCAWPTYDLDDSEWDVFFFWYEESNTTSHSPDRCLYCWAKFLIPVTSSWKINSSLSHFFVLVAELDLSVNPQAFPFCPFPYHQITLLMSLGGSDLIIGQTQEPMTDKTELARPTTEPGMPGPLFLSTI